MNGKGKNNISLSPQNNTNIKEAIKKGPNAIGFPNRAFFNAISKTPTTAPTKKLKNIQTKTYGHDYIS